MVIEVGPLQIDFGGTDAGQVGESACDMSDYTAPVTYRNPPPGYEERLSTDGGTEIVFPPVPVWRALLQAFVGLLLLAWMWVLIEGGMGMFSVIFALVAAFSLIKLAVQCSTRTSLVVSDHRILRRRSLAGLPASQNEFVVELLEIDNGIWNTGRGSTDTLTMVTTSGRHKLESTEAGVTEANKTGELWWKRVSASEPYRVAPEPGRDPIAADILHLGQFLARHANVPLGVVVRQVREPDYGD
jgi:hypothetical protein